MRTIVIGVDDSTRAEDAVAFGRRLAGATSGPIVLVCSFPPRDMASRAANLTYPQALEQQQATATVRRMRGRLELPAEAVRLMGDPAHELAAHSAKLDVMVMGSRGYGPLGDLFDVPASAGV